MPLYEHVYMARQDLSAQQVEEMTATYKGVIEGLGGKLVTDPEYWGVKTLSFRIIAEGPSSCSSTRTVR